MNATRTALLLLLLLPGWMGCDSTDDEDTPEPAITLTVADLAADPTTGRDPNTGAPISANRYTFYSLRENRIVANTDSATTQWDVAFKGTTLLVNGGTSGPGQGGAQVMTAVFEEVTEAPASGWNVDNGTTFAIPSGSGNGWYNYNPATMVISPIPGRVLLLRTADGRYAKLRIVSYYKGNPATPDAFTHEARYYTFDFVFQPDGSRTLQ
jgi:hypothetical protein